MLVRNSVSNVSGDCLQSVRHWTDKILHIVMKKTLQVAMIYSPYQNCRSELHLCCTKNRVFFDPTRHHFAVWYMVEFKRRLFDEHILRPVHVFVLLIEINSALFAFLNLKNLSTSAKITAILSRSPENMKCTLLTRFSHGTVKCKSQTYFESVFKICSTCWNASCSTASSIINWSSG